MTAPSNPVNAAAISRRIRSFICFLSAVIALATVGQATAGALSDALESRDHVLLMRHADAPGFGDPKGYVLGDCATQRNLGADGKRQAVATGKWLRAEGTNAALVFSSPWCRCIETANLLGFGQAVIEKSLGSFFSEPARSKESTDRLERFVVTALTKKGSDALILVTHQVNIAAYVGEPVGSGDMVLAKVDSRGKVISYRLYRSPFAE